jgi:uncharacterized membrane protein
MTQPQTDRLVEDYLGAVSYACADLPPDVRDDLVADLREHIAAARSVLYQPTEAAIRTILDRLGEPAAIAEEARIGEPPLRQHTAPAETYRRSSTAVLGMVLGFVLVIVIVLVLGSFLMMNGAPAPTVTSR